MCDVYKCEDKCECQPCDGCRYLGHQYVTDTWTGCPSHTYWCEHPDFENGIVAVRGVGFDKERRKDCPGYEEREKCEGCKSCQESAVDPTGVHFEHTHTFTGCDYCGGHGTVPHPADDGEEGDWRYVPCPKCKTVNFVVAIGAEIKDLYRKLGVIHEKIGADLVGRIRKVEDRLTTLEPECVDPEEVVGG